MQSGDSAPPVQADATRAVGGIEAFTFGEPEPVLNTDLLDYIESWQRQMVDPS